MDQAKYNLVNEYFLVGVTEELEDFIMLLEAALPRFFRGATDLYRTGMYAVGFFLKQILTCLFVCLLTSRLYNKLTNVLEWALMGILNT